MRSELLLLLLPACTILSFKPMYPCVLDSSTPESTPPDDSTPADDSTPPDDTSAPDRERAWSEADLIVVGTDGDLVGSSFTGADFRQDGGADLAIGAPGCAASGSALGCVYILGSVGDPGTRPQGLVTPRGVDAVAYGSGGGSFGTGIAAWTDARSGASLLAVGSPYIPFESTYYGVSYVFEPPSSGVNDVQQTASLLSGTNEDLLGTTVTNVGDVDADGLDDLVLGAPYDRYSGQSVGVAWLITDPVTGSGSPRDYGAAIYSGTSESIGAAVASLDNNQDRFRDLVFGTPYFSPTSTDGGAWVLNGARQISTVLDNDAIPLFGSDGENAGASVAAGGDLDGDGHEDVAVGASQADSAAGRVYLVPGPITSATDLSGVATRISGTSPYMYVGSAVSFPGDVNGDGQPDLLTSGLVGFEPDQVDGHGAVWLFYGPLSGTLSTDDADLVFLEEADNSGGTPVLSRVGDVDGDGRDEVAFAYPYDSTHGDVTGALYLFYGAP